MAWSFAADGDGHGVDGLMAVVGSGDEQLTALRGRASVLRLLLNAAVRQAGGHTTSDR